MSDVAEAVENHLFKETCQWCRWWAHSHNYIALRQDAQHKTAQCHRNPPYLSEKDPMGRWPSTVGTQFCGEFERVPASEI